MSIMQQLNLAVLTACVAVGTRFTTSQVADVSGLPLSIVQATMRELKEAGYLAPISGGRNSDGVFQGAATGITEAGLKLIASA